MHVPSIFAEVMSKERECAILHFKGTSGRTRIRKAAFRNLVDKERASPLGIIAALLHVMEVFMRPMPANQLHPKVKHVWRINDAIWITLAYACCAVGFFIAALVEPEAGWAWIVVGAMTAIWAACLLVWLIVLPPIRYARWRYEVGEDELDIARGIIWRKRFVIPFVRVQNTDTRQGPILRAFGLASVTVATAAGEHAIPGLAFEEADVLRDRIAQRARLAQEDV